MGLVCLLHCLGHGLEGNGGVTTITVIVTVTAACYFIVWVVLVGVFVFE